MRPPIIMITGYGDIEMAVEAMRNGAHDFLQKPIQLAQLEKSIQRAGEIVGMRRELAHLRRAQHEQFDFIVGKNPQMHALFDHTRRAASTSVSVLITGETGTGKEVLASAIHQMGARASKPFIAINCAAIQSTVLESELFGYESGAFTGADKRKHGLMEVADGGTLFLDEIVSMKPDLQAKLLRATEEHAIRRVGATSAMKIDVRIIAASNRNLPAMIDAGLFREDLYWRLKVISIELPPLRERIEDIPALAGTFICKLNLEMGKAVRGIHPRALDALKAYRWPGNIRQLRNAIERAMVFADGNTLEIGHFAPDIAGVFA